MVGNKMLLGAHKQADQACFSTYFFKLPQRSHVDHLQHAPSHHEGSQRGSAGEDLSGEIFEGPIRRGRNLWMRK